MLPTDVSSLQLFSYVVSLRSFEIDSMYGFLLGTCSLDMALYQRHSSLPLPIVVYRNPISRCIFFKSERAFHPTQKPPRDERECFAHFLLPVLGQARKRQSAMPTGLAWDNPCLICCSVKACCGIRSGGSGSQAGSGSMTPSE